MAFTDEEVEKMIFVLLDAAEGDDWELWKEPGTMDNRHGKVSIAGERPFRAKNATEIKLSMEAFRRMESELDLIRYEEGDVYRVTPEGRKTLNKFRQKAKAAKKSLNLIAFSFGTADVRSLEQWASANNAHITMFTKDPAFRDNTPHHISELMDADVHGFLMSDAEAFKPTVLAQIYKTCKIHNFYVFIATKGENPLSDEDFPEVAGTTETGSITINISGNQNTIATHGGTNQQITNHLVQLEKSNPEIAKVLDDLMQGVLGANLKSAETSQILSRIEMLAKEISANPPKENHWSIMERAKGLVEYIVSIVSINHGVRYLLEHTDKLLPLITSSFGAS